MSGRLKLGQILVNKGVISPEQLAAALGEQEQGCERLGMTLVRAGVLAEETLIQVLAGQLGLPVARIRGKGIAAAVLELVPAELAQKHRCLPLFVRDTEAGEALFLGMDDPSDADVVDEIAFHVGRAVRPVLVAPSELEEALERYYDAWVPEAPATLPPVGISASAASADAGGLEPGLELPAAAPLLDPNPDGLALEGGELDLDGDSFGGFEEDLAEFASGEPFGGAEDELGGFAEEPFSADGVAEPATDPTGAVADAGSAASLEANVILQALAQLLVEKGVLTREEFAERVRQLAGHKAA